MRGPSHGFPHWSKQCGVALLVSSAMSNCTPASTWTRSPTTRSTVVTATESTRTDRRPGHCHPPVDEFLRYLALDNLLVNNDGYFLRTSDYHLFQGRDGRFVLIPHDVNETFDALEAGSGVPESVGIVVDPLWGADHPSKPLLSKLLAVPRLRAKYLAYLREMATTWLDWVRLAPIVKAYRETIQAEVERDTRKHVTNDEFLRGITETSLREGACGAERHYGQKSFVEARRAYLLRHPALTVVATK